MTLEELKNYLFSVTNQYFLGIENFELKEPVLKNLVQKALGIYSDKKHIEVVKKVKLKSNNFIDFKKIEDELGKIRYVKSLEGIYIQDFRNFYAAKERMRIPRDMYFWDRRKILHTKLLSGDYYICFYCNYILDDITFEDTIFLKIMEGLTYQYLGHARNDFGLSDLPFNIEDLKGKGEEILNSAIEELKSNGNYDWYNILI